MACRGWPSACLAIAHVAVPRLMTPNARRRPSVTSYAYGLLVLKTNQICQKMVVRTEEGEYYEDEDDEVEFGDEYEYGLYLVWIRKKF